MNIGRCRRAFSARSTAPRPMIGSELAVQETTMSNSAAAPAGRRAASSSPPKRAASVSPRSQRAVGDRDRRGWRAAKWVAASSIISPAPTNSTAGLAQVLEQLRRQPHRGRRHADRVRADLGRRCALPWRPRTSAGTSGAACVPSVPALSASRTACFIWPRICGSPSTIESSPLATRNAWRAADAALEHVGVRAQRLAG